MAYYRLDDALKEVKQGYIRSCSIHGDWSDYRGRRVVAVVFGEVWELARAVIRRDRDGQHGVINELRDVAVVSLKALLWFRAQAN